MVECQDGFGVPKLLIEQLATPADSSLTQITLCPSALEKAVELAQKRMRLASFLSHIDLSSPLEGLQRRRTASVRDSVVLPCSSSTCEHQPKSSQL